MIGIDLGTKRAVIRKLRRITALLVCIRNVFETAGH